MIRFALWIPLLTAVAAAAEKPRVVVILSIDQFRADYLTKHAALFGPDGFNRLLQGGAVFTDCRHRHAASETGPGHAVISTGCWGRYNGIIANNWFDPRTLTSAYCVGDDDHPVIVAAAKEPPLKSTAPAAEAAPWPIIAGDFKPKGISPKNLTAGALADQFKIAGYGKAIVLSMSLKDRSAVLLGGHAPDGAYWWDDATGKFTTSTFYRKTLPAWLTEFNARNPADAWRGKSWAKLMPESVYADSGLDAAPYETPYRRALGNAFPHVLPMPDPVGAPDRRITAADYYRALGMTPFGNDLLLDLVRTGVKAEKLGADDITDLLCISLSSNDYCGHSFGPYSHEMLDMLIRTDRQLAGLFTFFDDTFGKGRWVLGLSADHGCMPAPLHVKSLGLPGKKLNPLVISAVAEKALDDAFGDNPQRPWIAGVGEYSLYLNWPLIADRQIDRLKAERVAADAVALHDDVVAVFTRSELASLPAGPELGDDLPQLWSRDWNAKRSGDIVLSLRPWTNWTARDYPADHGTVYFEDQHVPLVFYGTGVKAGVHHGRVGVIDLAPTLAALANLSPPPSSQGRALAGAFVGPAK